MPVTPPPFRYIGGKWKLASWIIPQIPSHVTWVEVFGGAASVTLAKPRSQIEIYNDLDEEVVRFFLALRDHRQALLEKIEQTPYSRQLYTEWLSVFKTTPPTDPIERAARWYFLMRASFAGKFGSGFAASRSRKSGYWSAIDGLTIVANRFKGIVIEQLEWETCLQTYDGPQTVFYVDPPYYGCPEANRHMTASIDHQQLAKALHRLQAKVLLSHFADPVIANLYRDFRCVTRSIAINADGRVKERKGTDRSRRIEWLLMNFDPEVFAWPEPSRNA